MRGSTINTMVTLVTETCYSCGVPFGLPADFQQNRVRDHDTFYCPNGHGQSYFGKTPEQKLREENERIRRERDSAAAQATAYQDQAEAAERSARAYRGHATRLKNRVAKGKCPCCKHEFPDVAEHIATEHPGYAPEPVLPEQA